MGKIKQLKWLDIRVTKYFHNKGFGFIRGEDGNSYFIHASKLRGEYLDKGYYVFFKPYADDRSDYNAKNVNVIEVPEKKIIISRNPE